MARPYSLRDLQEVARMTRRESETWIGRGIISAPKSPGSGNHRLFSFFNLVEGVVAKTLASHFRPIWIEWIMTHLRRELDESTVAHLLDTETPTSGILFRIAFAHASTTHGKRRADLSVPVVRRVTDPRELIQRSGASLAPLSEVLINVTTASVMALEAARRLKG